MLCEDPIGFGQGFKKVYRSSDTGQTYRSAGVLGMDGIQAQLAASSKGNLAVATYSSGSFIYINDRGRTWTMPVGFGDGGAGWNDIVYTTNKEAWVVYAPGRLLPRRRAAVRHPRRRQDVETRPVCWIITRMSHEVTSTRRSRDEQGDGPSGRAGTSPGRAEA